MWLRCNRLLLLAGLSTAGVAWTSCALRRPAAPEYGIPQCPASAQGDLLSSDALQCWWPARHGHWRMLSYQSHLRALVVEVGAQDLRDAVAIARRLVDGRSTAAFSEILLYVSEDGERPQPRVRRVRWTQDAGFETLDFAGGLSVP